ncbi:uncharacterized protein LOC134848284 [Symsagittifera roscoffensis]|uniref:uncharacterized protein LOC134848284 n=1 Tax=Symsagittifera roscoffensis TaxID=84072 RepID=UPI00307C3E82
MTGSCSVLMVCLGNICRSPIAEALLRHKWNVIKNSSSTAAKVSELTVDSCGTAGYHIGNPPDIRGLLIMKKNGIETSHRCRKLRSSDADDFDYIFCMDYSNVQNVKRVLPQSAHSKVLLLGSFDPQGVEEIEDPYYGSEDGFDVCFEHCGRCLDEFIKQKLLALTS